MGILYVTSKPFHYEMIYRRYFFVSIMLYVLLNNQ
nr:MAG TPA: hypothetical protein [Caudoviricetes sp.]